MAKQSPAQQKTVARVMHEFKRGELEKPDGKPVDDTKQAIAIALHEAGAARTEDAATNTRNLRRTKHKEHAGRTAQAEHGGSKADLYAEARRRDIPGRSRMTKDQLAKALGR